MSKRPKNQKITIRSKENCECGQDLPMHLVGAMTGNPKALHICKCLRIWYAEESSAFVYRGEAETTPLPKGVHSRKRM